METKVPYNYINLVAFLNLLRYENIRSITISNLIKYRGLVLQQVIDDFKSTPIVFSEVDDNEELKQFLSKYSAFVYLENDTLYLKSSISEKDINEELSKIKKEWGFDDRYDAVLQQRQFLNELGISKVYDFLVDYWNFERKIEKEYMSLSFNGKDLNFDFKKNLLFRFIFLLNFRNASDELVEAIKNTSTSICFDEDDYDYDDFPLCFDFWENEEYYVRDKDDLFDDVSDSLFWIYQYAIFGEESLSAQKLWKDIDYIYMYELGSDENNLDEDEIVEEECCFDTFDDFDLSEFDEEELEEILDDDTDMADHIFYLLYIDKINKYILEYGEDEELLKVKRRLLYTLDKPDLCLFNEDNFKMELEDALENDEVTFDIFKDETRFMASEVFLAPEDKNTVKKLLFISTYYELSEDDAIKEIMDKYSNHEKYGLYTKIVFGKQKSKKII